MLLSLPIGSKYIAQINNIFFLCRYYHIHIQYNSLNPAHEFTMFRTHVDMYALRNLVYVCNVHTYRDGTTLDSHYYYYIASYDTRISVLLIFRNLPDSHAIITMICTYVFRLTERFRFVGFRQCESRRVTSVVNLEILAKCYYYCTPLGNSAIWHYHGFQEKFLGNFWIRF